MSAKSYIYTRSNDDLADKIAGGCGVAPLAVMRTIYGDTQVIMPDTLPADVKAFLDEFMATRGLVPTAKGMLIHATTLLVGLPQALGPAWTILGGVVTNPSFFVPNVGSVIGLLTGSVKTTGVGAKLRLVEEVAGNENILVEQDVPDTSGVWQTLQFISASPSAVVGEKTYTLRGDAGSIAAETRFTSLALVEVLQV